MSRNRKFLYVYTILFLLLAIFTIWVVQASIFATGRHLTSPFMTSTVSGTVDLNITVENAGVKHDFVATNVTFNLTGPVEGSNVTVRYSSSNDSLSKSNITFYNFSLDTTTLPDGRYFIRYEVNYTEYYNKCCNTSLFGNVSVNTFVAFQDGTSNVTSDVFIDNTPPNITLSYPSPTGNGTCFTENDSVEISGIARDMLNFTIGINDTRFRGNWSKSNTSYTFGKSIDYLTNLSGTELSFNYTAGQALTDGWYTIALAANDSCCGNLSGGKASDDRTAQVYNLSRGVSTNLRVLGVSFLLDTTRPVFTYSDYPLWVESAIEPNDNSRVAKRIEGGYYRLDPGEKFKLHCDFADTNIREVRYYLQIPGSGSFIRLTPDTPSVDRGANDCATTSKTCTYVPKESGTYEAYCEIIEGSNDVNTTCDKSLDSLGTPTSKINNAAYKFKVEPTLDFSDGGEAAPESVAGKPKAKEEAAEVGAAPEAPEAVAARPTITPRRTTGVWVVAGIVAVGVLAYLVVVFLRRRK